MRGVRGDILVAPKAQASEFPSTEAPRCQEQRGSRQNLIARTAVVWHLAIYVSVHLEDRWIALMLGESAQSLLASVIGAVRILGRARRSRILPPAVRPRF